MFNQTEFYEAKLAYEIDAWDLNAAREAGEAVVVVDTRAPQAYAAAHLPGAINIPHREMSEQAMAAYDRGPLYVTYCDGIGCNASTKGALNLARLGFRVKELMGGIEWWQRDGYQTDCGC